MQSTDSLRTITLGMGCFWSPDALFGQLPGVVRTRVGYAEGTTEAPVYRELGDHTETVEVVYDERRLPLETILDVFWNGHKPDNINDYKGRQYLSLLLYRDGGQLKAIEETLQRREAGGRGRPATEIGPFQAFYPAEDRHQKYYLKRYPDAVEKLSVLFPTHEDLVNGTLPARLNGVAKGYANRTQLLQEIRTWEIGVEEREAMLRLVESIRW
ncbi:peptide-methionine (S)-S-oxide reductase [Paenibacillus mucilaginosus]|uniref:peptide-methionine (S)-S-oxide reductase MsrA n=1 Tax=Paenibacillus mucilaginosus TaxID=61624 RepID=UPI003D1D664C